MQAPELKKYFWDTDFASLDIDKHKKYILERLLEMGDVAAAKWMCSRFSAQEILAVLKKSRRISKKSFNFWSLVLSRG